MLRLYETKYNFLFLFSLIFVKILKANNRIKIGKNGLGLETNNGKKKVRKTTTTKVKRTVN